MAQACAEYNRRQYEQKITDKEICEVWELTWLRHCTQDKGRFANGELECGHESLRTMIALCMSRYVCMYVCMYVCAGIRWLHTIITHVCMHANIHMYPCIVHLVRVCVL